MLSVGLFIIIFLLCLTQLLWKLYISSLRDRNSKCPLPPGGVGLPILGEMPAMILDAARGQDFYTKRRLAHGNIYKTHVMGRPIVRVIGTENIKTILQAEGTKSENYSPDAVCNLLGSNSLAVCNGAIHKMKRKIITKAFNTEALAGYTDVLGDIVKEEMSTWIARDKGVRVFHEVGRITIRAAWEVLVGMRGFKGNEEKIIPHFDALLKGLWTLPFNLPGTAYHKALKARGELIKLIVKQNEERKTYGGLQEPTDYHDALSLILQSAEEQNFELQTEEVIDSVIEMLVAGHSTTSSAMTSVVRRLSENPQVLQKLREELSSHDLLDPEAPVTYEKICGLKYLGDVIYETLRIDPPVGGGFRKAKNTIELEGYQIPKGWTIIYSIADTHEVSDVYSDARNSFKPERWQQIRESGQDSPYNFATFGAGPRSCVGKEYAKTLLRVFTINLVRNFEWQLLNPNVKMRRLPVRQPIDELPTVFRLRRQQISSQIESTTFDSQHDDRHARERQAMPKMAKDDINMNVAKVLDAHQVLHQRLNTLPVH